MSVKGKDLVMELDSGAAASMISSEDFKEVSVSEPVFPTDLELETNTHKIVSPSGMFMVKVYYKGQSAKVELYM